MIVAAWRAARSMKARSQASESIHHDVDGAAQPQPDVGGNLVVARACGVQALPRVANQCDQPFLDIEMNVLELARPRELAARDFVANRLHSLLDVGQIRCLQHADRRQHPRMGKRCRNVDVGEPAVEIHRCRVAFDEIGDRLAETAGPGAGDGCIVGRLRVDHGTCEGPNEEQTRRCAYGYACLARSACRQ
jgi:hypothetical protein